MASFHVFSLLIVSVVSMQPMEDSSLCSVFCLDGQWMVTNLTLVTLLEVAYASLVLESFSFGRDDTVFCGGEDQDIESIGIGKPIAAALRAENNRNEE
mmetsp:Transcript_32900/g.79595  ORF Transcript_32900/g.79595 Transcript_32900/m.79595 type:complete len:98 (-) Transcript_32900:256-549(-)